MLTKYGMWKWFAPFTLSYKRMNRRAMDVSLCASVYVLELLLSQTYPFHHFFPLVDEIMLLYLFSCRMRKNALQLSSQLQTSRSANFYAHIYYTTSIHSLSLSCEVAPDETVRFFTVTSFARLKLQFVRNQYAPKRNQHRNCFLSHVNCRFQ